MSYKKAFVTLIVMMLTKTFVQAQQLYINEVMSKNDTTIADIDGEFSDWLEIYNSDSNAVSLEGYSLSDNVDLPARWKFGNIEILGKSFLLVFASGKDRKDGTDNPHTDFKIKSAGEPLLLSNPDGELIDSVFTGKIPPDYSRGRQPDGSAHWLFFKTPTPGAPNTSEGSKTIIEIALPNIEQDGGFYTNRVEVHVSSDFEGGDVRFTTDGSEPDSTSRLYTEPLQFTETTVLRARVLDASTGVKSKTSTRTFFINDSDHGLPVFSISTAPDNLWGENGIYEEIEWEGESLIDIEVPVNIEMFENDGSVAFNHRAGAEIFGGGSTGFEQKSLAILFRSRYDIGELSYKLFPKIPLMEFESFILRNSGNDWWSTMIRDAITYSLVKGNKNLDFQAYRPSVVYLNGEYWGIHNIREKISEHFIEHHHFVAEEELDLLEYKEVPIPIIKHGDLDNYNEIIGFLENYDLASDLNYQHISSLIDIDNFIDYQVMETFAGNIDWPANNNKFWRSRNEGGKWRWIIYDTDTGYGLWDDWWEDGTTGYYVNHIHHATNTTEAGGNAWPNPAWSTFIFRKLLENEGFKTQFVNRYLDLLNTTLAPENTLRVIEELHSVIELSLPRHLDRWDRSQGDYRYELSKLQIFVNFRPEIIRKHLKEYFQYPSEVEITVGVQPPEGGLVNLNTLFIEQEEWTGKYFGEVPIKLAPIPNPGFNFSHWEGGNGSINDVISVLPSAGISLTAVFAPDSIEGSLVINEINYSSFNVADPGDWLEFYNGSVSTIQLENWYVSNGRGEEFHFPENTQIGSGEYLVICRECDQFNSVFGSDISLVCDLNFGFSAKGDSLTLYNQERVVIDEVYYDVNVPWPRKQDDSGQTIELVNPDLDNSVGENWSLSKEYGTPGDRNSQFQRITAPSFALIDTSNESNLFVYPNPFLGSANVQFYTEEDGMVEVKIYNILGHYVTSIARGHRPSGVYETSWHGYSRTGRIASSGVYIAVLYVDSKKFDAAKIVKF